MLKKLTEAFGVSGCDKEVRDIIIDEIICNILCINDF